MLKVVCNRTDSEIATELHISVHTLADWKKRTEWREATDLYCAEALNEAVHGLQALNRKAVAVLCHAMDDENPRIRLAAARVALEHGLGSMR